MRRLLIAGCVVFVLSLLLNFPAALAVRWFAPSGLAMQGVAGTVWSGSAAQASYLQAYLGELDWQFRPLSVLAGRLGYKLNSRSPLGNFTTHFSRSLAGTLRIDSLQGSTRLSSIGALLPPQVPTQMFDAGMDLALSNVVLVDGWPAQASGSIKLNAVQITGQREILGSYQIQIEELQGGEALVARFQDTDGSVEIKGRVDIMPDGNYQMECTASARPGAPAGVINVIDLICPPGQGS